MTDIFVTVREHIVDCHSEVFGNVSHQTFDFDDILG